MKSAFKNRKRTFFRKTFILILGSVSSLIFICSILLSVMQNKIKENTIIEQNALITAYSSSMEDIFTNAKSIISYIEVNHETTKVLLPGYQENNDSFQSQNTIVNDIKRFSVVSENISEILVYSKYHDTVYTSHGIMRPQTYFNNRYDDDYFKWVNLLDKTYLENYIFYSPLNIKTDDGNRTSRPSPFTIIKSIRSSNRDIGQIVISLEESVVERIFEDKAFAKGRFIYILDENDNILSSNIKSLDKIDINRDELDIAIEKGTFSGKTSFISYRYSKNSKVKYVIITPKSVVFNDINRVIILVNLSFICVGIISLVAVYVVSKQISKPFYSIFTLLSEHSSTERNQNELEDAKMLVTDIVSKNFRLNSLIKNTSNSLLENGLFKLILGNQTEIFQNEMAGQHDIQIGEGFFNVFVIYIDNSNIEDNFFLEHEDEFRELVEQYLDKWMISIVPTNINEYSIVTFSREKEDINKIEGIFYELQNILYKTFENNNFFIGYGSWVEDILTLRLCYKNAVDAIKFRSVDSPSMVIKKQPKALSKKYYLPSEFEAELLSFFKKGKEDDILNYIKHILFTNLKRDISNDSFVEMCLTINNFIIRYAKNVYLQDFEELLLIDSRVFFYNYEQLQDIIISNINIIFQIAEAKTHDEKPVIETIVKFIDDNFNQDINLNITADSIGYTPNYLSRYFKQMKGMNFTDYLNRKKIEHAKMLLSTTKKTTRQIMKESGFNNSSLFFKTFEKYEGITPGEFRKLKLIN